MSNWVTPQKPIQTGGLNRNWKTHPKLKTHMVWFICASPRSKPTRRPPYIPIPSLHQWSLNKERKARVKNKLWWRQGLVQMRYYWLEFAHFTALTSWFLHRHQSLVKRVQLLLRGILYYAFTFSQIRGWWGKRPPSPDISQPYCACAPLDRSQSISSHAHR